MKIDHQRLVQMATHRLSVANGAMAFAEGCRIGKWWMDPAFREVIIAKLVIRQEILKANDALNQARQHKGAR